ncbi:sporulation protein YabP [Clostridium grantii]|uniref:Sporulation protein YabP n=1 Tax=Clostridium grantii DSM 8605 TaxID=1121316 RepID=A0A1M5X9M4_9CLOT|nr:sporulation protein YabP [Clostridium grantii]SHH96362.1 sporulation protein YabP [Clostridium grantii DSM 8605]
MEGKKEIVDINKSSLSLENRNKLILSGVSEVITFDEAVIQLDTKLGKLTIKGEELKMNKLDVQYGDVVILGQVNSMIYSSTQSKSDKESIIARLFR